jgi:hypothetical protein
VNGTGLEFRRGAVWYETDFIFFMLNDIVGLFLIFFTSVGLAGSDLGSHREPSLSNLPNFERIRLTSLHVNDIHAKAQQGSASEE